MQSQLTEKNIKLIINKAECPTTLFCDGTLIGQVIKNILSNAINFSPKNTIIKITFAKDYQTPEQSTVDKNRGASISAFFEDQGIIFSQIGGTKPYLVECILFQPYRRMTGFGCHFLVKDILDIIRTI